MPPPPPPPVPLALQGDGREVRWVEGGMHSTAQLGEMVNFHFFRGSFLFWHSYRQAHGWHKAFDIAFDIVRWPYRLNDQLFILLAMSW